MTFVESYANYAVDFIENLNHTGDFYGQPFLLLPWQEEAVSKFYGTLRNEQHRHYQYLYLEIPKKNGKTELAAALGLFHTFADEAKEGEVYIVAADKQNASICFNAALSMLKQCPELMARAKIRESYKEIEDKASGTIMKVLSSESYSKHGYKPTCVIFDELHAQPNRGLWDVMTFGAGSSREQPVWIVLTTAGDDPDKKSIGWEIHKKAESIIEYRKGNIENNYDIPTWLAYIFGLPEAQELLKDIDIYDEKVWYECNPSLGHSITIETLRNEAIEARNSPAVERLFRWLRLNQWIAVKTTGWLELTLYDKNAKTIPDEMLRGKKCYLGLDLSATTDLTAKVALFPPQPGLKKWYAKFTQWIPDEGILERGKRDGVDFRLWSEQKYINLTLGDCIDYDIIEHSIVGTCKENKVIMGGTDPWNSRTLTQRLLEQKILEIIEVTQNMANLSPAMKLIEILLRKGELQLEENPCVRWTFGNVRVASDGNGNIKPMKNKSTGRIDPMVALIISMAVAMLNEKVDINEKIKSDDWSL